ncbi:zinc ribbon domain-containing protein [Candidatus Bathyarchaeota archaeon]|nr:zinc ribbon domain-containing protein [Candidatus Bathyarchaeota archaeon]MBS7631142.1 zinc ribbon domain-containing protein [Candidatus Bathyarchaeota archaeon]
MSQVTALAMAYPAKYYINLVIGILSTLSGVILIALGGFASLLKVFTELIISEIKNPKEMVQSNPLCKRCGREYPIGSKYCSNCGSELS